MWYVGSYVCSYKVDKTWRDMVCDLYVWDNPDDYLKVGLCIRHGERDSDYYSPDINSIIRHQHEPYLSAYAMMIEKGYFTWKWRT